MDANPFWEKTVGQMLDAVAARYPGRGAIVSGDERLTYRDLHRQAERLARGLLVLGLKKEDTLAIWLPNRPAWLVCQYACAKIGVAAVALNTRYRAHELGYILAQSDSTTLLLTDHLGPVDFLEILLEVLPKLRRAEPGALEAATHPMLSRVIVDAEDPYPGCLRLKDVLEAGDDPGFEPQLRATQVQVQPDDLFMILYTSGTTSLPKGAMISHRNCLPHGWNCGVRFRATPEDRVLLSLPLSGTWGGLCTPLMTFTHGACLVVMDRFDPGVALYLMEKERITIWNAVDAMIQGLLEHPDLDRFDRSSLRTGGLAMTAGGAQALFDAAVERLGIRQAFQPWGMTEVNAMALLHDLDEPQEIRRLPGVRPAPGLEARVANPETGKPCRQAKKASFRSEARSSPAATTRSPRRRRRRSPLTAGSGPATSRSRTRPAARSSRGACARCSGSATSWLRRPRSRSS